MSAGTDPSVDALDIFDIRVLYCLGSNCQGLFCPGNPEPGRSQNKRLDRVLPKILLLTIVCCRPMRNRTSLGPLLVYTSRGFAASQHLMEPRYAGRIASSPPG